MKNRTLLIGTFACVAALGMRFSSFQLHRPASSLAGKNYADTVYYGELLLSRDYLGSGTQDAIAIKAGKVVFMGSRGGVLRYIGRQTRVIEVKAFGKSGIFPRKAPAPAHEAVVYVH